MSRKMMGIMAATMALASVGMDMPMMDPGPKRREPPPKKPLTPEELAAELEKRIQQFKGDLEHYNIGRRAVGKTKDFVINGMVIASSNPKNAVKAMRKLLLSNGLDYKPMSEEPIKNDEEYQICLKRFEEVFQAEVGTAESVEADILSKKIQAYEKANFPMEEPSIQSE